MLSILDAWYNETRKLTQKIMIYFDLIKDMIYFDLIILIIKSKYIMLSFIPNICWLKNDQIIEAGWHTHTHTYIYH